LKIRTIAEQLQTDLIESPAEKPPKIRTRSELKFVQGFLGDWGCELSGYEIRTLAAKAKSYEAFMRTATK
jgi:hypothetical protein